MHNSYAIRLQNVSKVYKLFGSHRDQLIDILGLQRLGIKPKAAAKEFVALNNISLDVPRGHRIGVVGRNGAGKTTLLKLLCGNFACSSGTVEVNGEVQALMNVGVGFHPEYTGRENVEASLQYSGLSRNDYQQAMDGIIEFCELGDFLDQPFKTYSLGMQARLMFAAATAIRPDILIVDEVLGAGDAYFVAKSKTRVEKLVNSGCTMLLVSHSMQQVLELCDEAIWLERGRIRMQGTSFEVVKAYEEHLFGGAAAKQESAEIVVSVASSALDSSAASAAAALLKPGVAQRPERLQEPRFVPNGETDALPSPIAPTQFDFVAKGGISRWDSAPGIKFLGFTILTENGNTNELAVMRPAKFVAALRTECDGVFAVRYAVAIYDHLGRRVLDILSGCDAFECTAGATRTFEMLLNPVQLGPGEYFISLSVHEYGSIEFFNSTRRFDLLSRSFSFKVALPESLGAIEACFYHTAEWDFY
jgi:lipopolysaccharide transport system ATP-binding protein